MLKKILVAVGGDDASLEPARVAGRLAAQCGAPLTIISVKRPVPDALGEPFYSRADIAELTRASQLLETARRVAMAAGAEQAEVEWLEGDAAERIARYATSGGFDLLVIGSRHRELLPSRPPASVSAAVAASASVPLMIVPEPNAPAGRDRQLAVSGTR